MHGISVESFNLFHETYVHYCPKRATKTIFVQIYEVATDSNEMLLRNYFTIIWFLI